MRYGMTVDEKLCVTCNACVLACKNENQVPDGEARCWTVQEERGVFPLALGGDPQRALQPLRERALRERLPHRAPPTTKTAASWWWTRRSAWAARRASSPAPTRFATCTPTGTSTSAPSACTG